VGPGVCPQEPPGGAGTTWAPWGQDTDPPVTSDLDSAAQREKTVNQRIEEVTDAQESTLHARSTSLGEAAR
jgi:hypothetical protein